MRKTSLAARLGATAVALALAGCSSTVADSAAPPHGSGAQSVAPPRGSGANSLAPPRSSGARHAAPARTVADLGTSVQHNMNLANSVHLDLSMQVPGTGIVTATGDAQFTGAQVAEQLTMTIPNVGNMHVVVVAGTVYLNLPPDLAGTTGGAGKPWVKVTTSGSSGASGQLQSLAQTAILATQADPTHLLQRIAPAGTITTVTQETLDGVGTTHYAITVDAARLGQSDPAEQQTLTSLGITSLPFAIWLNSGDLPVRVVTVVPVSASTVTQGRQFSITVNYSHWGAPVAITAPPTNEVAPPGGN